MAMYTTIDFLVISTLLIVALAICVAWMNAVPCPKWLNKMLSDDYDYDEPYEKYDYDD